MKLVSEQPVYFGTKNRGAASPERQRAHLHVLRPEQLTEQLVYSGTKNRGAATPDEVRQRAHLLYECVQAKTFPLADAKCWRRGNLLSRVLLGASARAHARAVSAGERESGRQTTRTDVLDARVFCLGFSRQVSFGLRVSSRIEMTRNQVLLAALLGKKKRLLLRASCPHAPRPSPRPSFAAFPGRAQAHAHYLSLSPRHARRAHAARRTHPRAHSFGACRFPHRLVFDRPVGLLTT